MILLLLAYTAAGHRQAQVNTRVYTNTHTHTHTPRTSEKKKHFKHQWIILLNHATFNGFQSLVKILSFYLSLSHTHSLSFFLSFFLSLSLPLTHTHTLFLFLSLCFFFHSLYMWMSLRLTLINFCSGAAVSQTSRHSKLACFWFLVSKKKKKKN